MAGTGKSTVANTVANIAQETLRVPLSCFFCRQGDPELSDPKRIFPTLASRFAQPHPTYLDAILRVLQSDQDLDVINGTLDKQFKLLFTGPLESTADPMRPHVVVIDALDETGNATSRRDIAKQLLVLAQLAPWLRIFVTSRKNEEINAVLGNDAGCLSVDIHEASQKEEDIRRYVTARFADLACSPSEDIVRKIVARADGLFIWCSTVFKYFEDSANPERDLRRFLQNSSSNSTLSPLFQLYDQVLQSAAPVAADAELLRFLLGAIFVTAGNQPLSASSLWALIRHDGRFADEDEAGTSVNTLISRLHAVLYEEHDSDRAIRAYHQSFLDFIQHKLEDHNSNWKAQLDLPTVHLVMATSCLGVMRAELKFNICGIETLMANRDVPQFEYRVSTMISPQLRYGCLFLWDHTSHCLPRDWDSLRPSLSYFIDGILFLLWLEVLSSVNGVGRAVRILGECARCLGPVS